MKIAAKPAVSNSDAGTRASSSRLRAVTNKPLVDLAPLELDHQVLRVVLGAQLVVGERRPAGGGDRLERDPRARVAAVEVDAEGQLDRQAAVDRDRVPARLVDADEVDGAGGEPEAAEDHPEED